MKYKLYYTTGSCSAAVHFVLNKIKADYELINVASKDGGKTKPQELLEVNPRGAVPVLKVDDKEIIREGVAIILYLLESKENDLLPKNGINRAIALEWLAFANSTLHPAYSRMFFMKKVLGDNIKDNNLLEPFIKDIQRLWDDVEGQLSKSKFIAGDNLTVADALLVVIAGWTKIIGAWLNKDKLINFGPRTTEWFKKVKEDEAFKLTEDQEKINISI